MQYRAGNGEFKEWPDLRKVPEIDVKKLEEQRDRIVFTPVSTPSGDPKYAARNGKSFHAKSS